MTPQHFKEDILNLLNNQQGFPNGREIAIEDFIDFDKNTLAEYRILYTIFGKEWYWFYNVAAGLIILTMISVFTAILFSATPNYWLLLLYVPGIIFLFFLVRK